MRRALTFLLLFAALPLAAQERLPDPPTAGTVVDMQGRAYVRPAGHARWSPVRPGTRLLIGDSLKTGLRGAHAVEVRLPRSGRVLLGPGSIARFPKPELFLLVEGEAEIRTKGRSVIRKRDGTKTNLDHDPAWVTGYRASTTDEWLGSLVATVDGRSVPLTIGYHHVRVVIRDQVAETTIDESFVNSTDRVLEGEFVFPLPADASISGFGMWIDDELVMADVVERQRARAIYEDIKRRRVDPALLEWAGGNLFKASVFPIPAHGEKRIRIRYTQALPLTGNTFRYRYPLASEMLRAHPLRDLSLRVDVHSTVPIRAAACPSHDTTVESAKHSARIEHTARSVSPDRDFEAEFTLKAQPPLVAVPHRRGEDGYFLLLLSPPDPDSGPLTRELTPDSEPLDLVLLLDTSGSMGPADRKAQAEFVAALLDLKGEKDRARIAVCDTALHWIEDPAAAAARPSLGWSDLGRALDEVLEAAGPGAHVIYVGDGRVTARGETAEDLARKLRGSESKATAHAVSTGSSFERPVLEALASIGGGTVRAADPEPARAAYRLLAEIARPALKDLAVSFEGIRTARVYPDRLPNLPAGTQQAILGRFLVTGGDQEGLVVVTGTRDGKPVRFTAPLVVREGEEGNSFLPRLWARRHLDALLAEELTKPIRAEIVETSQRFSIMTPLTSFLVLESDADREHYGVRRTFAMRDGERFFTEAREAAGRELLADQMRKAHGWRIGLRDRMAREIRRLGRDLMVDDWGSRSGFGFFEESMPLFGMAEEGEQLLGGGADEYVDEEAEEEFEETDGDYEVSVEDEEIEPMKACAFIEGAPLTRVDWTRTRRLFAGKAPVGIDDWRLHSLTSLFPYLDEPWEPDGPEVEVTGTEEARKLLRSLDRRKALTDFPGGVELSGRFESLHPIRGTLLHFGKTHVIATKDAWVLTEEDDVGDPTITWCAGEERGALIGSLRIGRARPAVEADRRALPELPGAPGRDFFLWGKGWRAEILSRDEGRAVIALTWRDASWPSSRLTIDTARGVLLEVERLIRGKLGQTTVYDEHVLAAGVHWPTRMVTTDAKGRVTQRNTIAVRDHPEETARAMIADLRGSFEDAILLPEPMPSDRDARQAAHEGRATFADHLALALLDARFGRQDEMLERWRLAERLVEGKPGAAFIRAGFLSILRSDADLKKELAAIAVRIAAPDTVHAPALAEWVYLIENDRLASEEMLGLLATLQPAWDRPGEHRERLLRRWTERRIAALHRGSGRAEVRRLRRALVAAYPDDPSLLVQSLYGGHYAPDGVPDLERAIAALARDDRWTDQEASRIYYALRNTLESSGRHADLVRLAARWRERLPADRHAHALHLSLLADEDRFEERDAWIEKRLTVDVQAGPEDDAARARARTAIDAALGVNLYGRDPRWGPLLRDAGLLLVLRDGPASALGRQSLGNDAFLRTDAGRELRAGMEQRLASRETLSSAPLSALRPLLTHLGIFSTFDDELWRVVTAGLAARFSERKERAIGVILARELSRRGEFEESVRIRRALLAADEDADGDAARELMEELLKLPWTPERESEAFGLLPRIVSPDDEFEERRAALAEGTAGLVTELFTLREKTLLPDAAKREQWPRA